MTVLPVEVRELLRAKDKRQRVQRYLPDWLARQNGWIEVVGDHIEVAIGCVSVISVLSAATVVSIYETCIARTVLMSSTKLTYRMVSVRGGS